jgi:hypothetical protein
MYSPPLAGSNFPTAGEFVYTPLPVTQLHCRLLFDLVSPSIWSLRVHLVKEDCFGLRAVCNPFPIWWSTWSLAWLIMLLWAESRMHCTTLFLGTTFFAMMFWELVVASLRWFLSLMIDVVECIIRPLKLPSCTLHSIDFARPSLDRLSPHSQPTPDS